MVVVVHGSLRTTYEPVLALVRPGTHVTGGQQIAALTAGHGGCPVGACLHWGLLRADAYLDPMSVLATPAIRLLPPAGVDTTSSEAHPAGQLSAGRMEGAALRPSGPAAPGPSAATWSLVALAGAGVLVAHRRR